MPICTATWGKWVVSVSLCFLLAGAAHAQVELIVRLDDDPQAGLRSALEAEQPGDDQLQIEGPAGLFEGVRHTRRLFQEDVPRDIRPGEARIEAFALTLDDSTAFRRAKERWVQAAGVAYVQRVHIYTVDDAASQWPGAVPFADSLTHLDVIRAPEAWELTSGEETVTIGLIDTGLYFDHPDLQGRIQINPLEDGQGDGRCNLMPVSEGGDFTGRDDSGSGYIDDVCGFNFVHRSSALHPNEIGRGPDPSAPSEGGHFHGTAVAGILAASLGQGHITGVAPGARLLPLRAFDTHGQGRDDEIAEAIVYAADRGVDVLNMSFGDIYHSPLLREAIRYAHDRGVVLVASAGNNGTNDPHYPSDFDEVISVAWLDEEGLGRTAFSSYGPHLDLGAPGSDIYTATIPAPDDELSGYARSSGSSLAAPQVAGVAALLRSLDPDLTPQSIRSILTRTAHQLGGGWNERTGAGRLDAAAAVYNVLPGRVDITHPANDDGAAPGDQAILGSAVDPHFESYVLEYARGYDYSVSSPQLEWETIAGPIARQVLDDTLAVWETGDLVDDKYMLRLRVKLRNGQEHIVNRRYFLYRTPPRINLHLLSEGIAGASRVLMADVGTDHLTEVRMEVEREGQRHTVESDRRARRHGLMASDQRGDAGPVAVRITARNVAGFSAEIDTTIDLGDVSLSSHLFEEDRLNVPSGQLLPRATDWNGNGLKELVLSPYRGGQRSDTLHFFEWQGDEFAQAHTVHSQHQRQVIPRDVGLSCSGDDARDGLLFTSVDGTGMFVADSGGYPEIELNLSDHVAPVDSFDASGALFGLRWIQSGGEHVLVDWQEKYFRLLECDGERYTIRDHLVNPTSADSALVEPNRFNIPALHAADLTGNDRLNLLVGDSDGDWIMFEQDQQERFPVHWTHTTPRVEAGGVFMSGRFMPDDAPQFITHNRAWPNAYRTDSLRTEREPPIHVLYLWKTNDNAEPELQDRFLLTGFDVPQQMEAVDFSGDGQDEIVLFAPPNLYVLRATAEGSIEPIYYFGPNTPFGSQLGGHRMVVDDFIGDGAPEIIVPGADGRMRRFTYSDATARYTPPRWVRSRPAMEGKGFLEWRAPGADSVQVFSRNEENDLRLIAATLDSTHTVQLSGAAEFNIRAWYDGEPSALSEWRRVVAAGPAVVEEVTHPEPNRINITFSQPLEPSLRASQFRLTHSGQVAADIARGQNGRGIYLRFDEVPSSRQDTLLWTGVRDAFGRSVEERAVAVSFPPPGAQELIVESWERVGEQSVRLRFSAAPEREEAQNIMNYAVEPFGHVQQVRVADDEPDHVIVEVGGTRIGATGRTVRLKVLRMRAQNGGELSSEGFAIDLNEAASDLGNVYVYPNPHHEQRHGGPIRVAGLPAAARVLILSVDGRRVTELEASSATGGVEWNREDDGGRAVPPGVYLVRVEVPGEAPVLKKVALIR